MASSNKVIIENGSCTLFNPIRVTGPSTIATMIEAIISGRTGNMPFGDEYLVSILLASRGFRKCPGP